MLKKRFTAILLISACLAPIFVSAITIENPLGYDSLEDFIARLSNFILAISLAIAPFLILIGAFYILTSAGEPKKVMTGQKIIMYTAVGLGIILFAKAIISLVRFLLS